MAWVKMGRIKVVFPRALLIPYFSSKHEHLLIVSQWEYLLSVSWTTLISGRGKLRTNSENTFFAIRLRQKLCSSLGPTDTRDGEVAQWNIKLSQLTLPCSLIDAR